MFNPLLSPACFAAPEFLSGASAWVRHMPTAFALIETLRPRVFVELGTYHGDSYFTFCQAVSALRTQTKCFAVDTWKGDEHAGFYGPEVLATLQAHNEAKFADFSTLLQTEFDSARSQFADGSIDLLHIDGFHSYEAVQHDFQTWLPALSDRGVVLFHDTRVREHGFGVWRLWEELCARYDHIEMQHAYGLGILAVGQNLPEAFQSMLAAARSTEGFDRFFDTLGLRVEHSLQITQQRAHIAHLEQQHSAASSQAAELRLEMERQAHRMLAEQVSLNAVRWQAQADRLQELLDQTQAEQQEVRAQQGILRGDLLEACTQQNACVDELHQVRDDLGQVIASLGCLQDLVADQLHVVQVVNRWRASLPYRCGRAVYLACARCLDFVRGREARTDSTVSIRIHPGSAGAESKADSAGRAA